MRDKNPYIMVGVPNTGTWCDETAKSMAIMFSHLAARTVPGVQSLRAGILTVQGSMIAQQRHLCVKKACQDPKVTHLLFIDSDMVFPKDTAHRLLAWDKDIVAANCTTRREPIIPVAFALEPDGAPERRVDSRGQHGLEKVRQVGPAVMLIRVEIFKKLRPPFFLQDWVPSAGYYCGEDVYFCQVVQAAGLDVWIDHDLSVEIKHVGAREWGWDDVRTEDVEAAAKPLRLVKQGAAS